MQKIMLGLAIGAMALTAGCSDRQERTVRDPATGAEVTVQSGERLRAPSNLPDYAPIYPGGQIENVMEGTSSGESGADSGGMVTIYSPADVETIARFYRDRFDATNLTERSETRISGALMLSAASPDNSSTGVQVSIAPAGDRDGSMISVVYSNGA